jgi:hypothetical protein
MNKSFKTIAVIILLAGFAAVGFTQTQLGLPTDTIITPNSTGTATVTFSSITNSLSLDGNTNKFLNGAGLLSTPVVGNTNYVSTTNTAAQTMEGALLTASLTTTALTVGVGAAPADGVTNVVNLGPGTGDGSVVTGVGSSTIFNVGDWAGSSAIYNNVDDIYNVGNTTGTSANLVDTYDVYSIGAAGEFIIATNSHDIFNFGNSAGNSMAVTNANNIYNSGDAAGYSMIATDSGDIYNYGNSVGKLMTATDSHYIYNFGDNAGKSMIATNSSDIYNSGDGTGYSMIATNSSDIYSYGNTAGQLMNLASVHDIYNIGYGAGKSMAATNSSEIYTFGSGLQSAALTNSVGVLALGRNAGNSISGAYTNVVLIGDGATLGATGKDQVILGPGMTLDAPGGYKVAGVAGFTGFTTNGVASGFVTNKLYWSGGILTNVEAISF